MYAMLLVILNHYTDFCSYETLLSTDYLPAPTPPSTPPPTPPPTPPSTPPPTPPPPTPPPPAQPTSTSPLFIAFITLLVFVTFFIPLQHSSSLILYLARILLAVYILVF